LISHVVPFLFLAPAAWTINASARSSFQKRTLKSDLPKRETAPAKGEAEAAGWVPTFYVPRHDRHALIIRDLGGSFPTVRW